MMTRQTFSKTLATALLLGAAATSAHAQFTTSGTYTLAGTPTAAGTNSESLAVFQTKLVAAATAGTAGDVTFDNVTFAAAPSFTATYGPGGANTLTVADVLLPGATGTYGPGSDAANATSGSNYIGFAGASNNNYNFTFSQNLSDFGIAVINRGSTRTLTFTATLSDNSTVTLASGVATSNGGAGTSTFFEYAPTGPLTIKSVTFSSAEGLTRFDDLGFITAPAVAAAPEPSQSVALSIGLLGIGMLALRARKRSIPA